ncbi:hypothetical protein AQI88_38395 [Streptomyces cellostaticus]|uniref:FAD-binding FR-type domain-containing protein n=1 Tax=Streptomyces cellostaticus TaxID=67285 RepID=A0A124HBG7_9ACTN|nr:hypothetical protein AQI88_38395 [Streptomyces cellostaticus]
MSALVPKEVSVKPLLRLLASPLLDVLAGPNGIDRYLAAVNPLWSVSETRARVLQIRHQTRDTVTLILQPNANWLGFRAGQHVRLGVEVNGVRRHRCFSPASSTHQRNRLIEISATVNPAGVVSQYLKHRAEPGEILTMSPAQGTFALPVPRPERLLMISAGSGITPVMSMLRTLCDEDYPGRVTFLHYARTQADMLYRDELYDIARDHPGITLVCAHTRQRRAGDLHGHLTEEQLNSIDADFTAAEAYVCGPPGLVDTARDIWTAHGVENRLHTETFTSALTMTAPATKGSVVRFARSGISATATGASLLEQAEASGLRPPFGCRRGICSTCTSRKFSGVVRHVLTGEASHTEEEQIRLCVSAPSGDVTLDL